MKRSALLLAAVLLLGAAPAKLDVGDPWVRESNPARNITAAYMTLSNPGARAVTIVGAASPAAKVVEMHEMKTINGTMSMRRVDRIVVPAHGSVRLAPGGMHLMLIDLVRPLAAGTSAAITLTLEDGATIAFEAPVKNPDADHHHH